MPLCVGLVRFSWSTTKKILLAKGPEVTWEDDGDDDGDEEAASRGYTFACMRASFPLGCRSAHSYLG